MSNLTHKVGSIIGIREAADREEVVDDAVLKFMHNAFHGLVRWDAVAGLIYTIVSHACIDKLRHDNGAKRKLDKIAYLDGDNNQNTPPTSSIYDDPEGYYLAVESEIERRAA